MKKAMLTPIVSAMVALGLSLTPLSIDACTSFIVKSSDNSYVYGRTLEFGIDLQSTPIAIPRNFNYQGTGIDGHVGKAWKTKYAAIGMNGIQLPILVDGINEKGMTGGLLYAPNTSVYQDVTAENAANSIASYEMLTYALTNFATVDEVKNGFQDIMINKTGHAPFKGAVPVHMTLHDSTGKSIVIEYNKGKLFIYDNPTGVMTNDPNFAYQLANIGIYSNLSAKEANPLDINGTSFTPPSSGSGLHGMPGDFLSPSRFIRAIAYAVSAPTNLTADKQVATVFHILNNFDVPPGSIQLSAKNPYGGGADGFEITEWLSAADAKNLIYYVKTYANPTVQMLDMKKINLDAKEIKTFKLQPNEVRLEIN
ncbi:MAG: choloylglycine hydrolase family protein [Legionella sp.]|nr:choloylglycine hydrolase family protein [Legionella sp.]